MKRLSYIDWMRGLACVLMFQTHCYDSWLSPEARTSSLFHLVTTRRHPPRPTLPLSFRHFLRIGNGASPRKGLVTGAIAKTTIRRGAEIFALGLLFRVQEYALGYRWVPWTDLLRVDILNMLGLSMMLMGVLCWVTAARSPANSTVLPQIVAASRNPRNPRQPSRRNHDSYGHSAPLDHLSPRHSPLAPRVLHQRRPCLRQAPTLALPTFPLVSLRICRAGRRLLPLHEHRQALRRLSSLQPLVGQAFLPVSFP